MPEIFYNANIEKIKFLRYIRITLIISALFSISIPTFSYIYIIENKTNKLIKLDFLVRYVDKTTKKEKISNLELEIFPYSYIEDLTVLVERAINKKKSQLNDNNFNNTTKKNFVLLENIDNKIILKSACLAIITSAYKCYERHGLLVISENDLPIVDGFVKI